nr:hypothetical protein [Tanacetum cinerariifolium]
QAADKIGCDILNPHFTYLGSNVGGNMHKIHAWDVIVDKLIVRLSKWKMKTLSIGDRLTLLKAVLGASKERGGLGVSSLYALNRALFLKWVWRFKTQKDLLWTRVIKAIHGENGRIGDYSKDDVWLGDIPLKYSFPRIYNLEVNKQIDVASKMTQVSLSASFRRCSRGGAEEAQMLDLMSLTDNVFLGDMNDRWFWDLDGLEEFSVASVRKVIDDIRLPCVSSQTRWIKEIPIK